ncbi:hypothetical protein ACMSZI_002869 [Cronobacter dublinensis]
MKRLIARQANNDAAPPGTAVVEGHKALHLRALLHLGPTAACEFHGKNANRRMAYPAEVLVTVLNREGDGTTDAENTATTKTLSPFCRQSQRKRGYACA